MAIGAPPASARGRDTSRGAAGRYAFVLEVARGYLGTLWVAHDPGDTSATGTTFVRHVAPIAMTNVRAALLESMRWGQGAKLPDSLAALEIVEGKTSLDIVTPAPPGEVLRTLLRTVALKHVPTEPSLLLAVAGKLLLEIQALHDHAAATSSKHGFGGVHPDSVFIDSAGRVMLLDVGASAAASAREPWRADPQRMGYMAPEQLDARAVPDARTDVFAVGVILWEALTNRRLFPGNDAKTVRDRLQKGVIARLDATKSTASPGIATPISDIVARALEREPQNRFASADQMARAISELGHADTSKIGEWVSASADAAIVKRRQVVERARAGVSLSGDSMPPPSPRTSQPPGALRTSSQAPAPRASQAPAPRASQVPAAPKTPSLSTPPRASQAPAPRETPRPAQTSAPRETPRPAQAASSTTPVTSSAKSIPTRAASSTPPPPSVRPLTPPPPSVRPVAPAGATPLPTGGAAPRRSVPPRPGAPKPEPSAPAAAAEARAPEPQEPAAEPAEPAGAAPAAPPPPPPAPQAPDSDDRQSLIASEDVEDDYSEVAHDIPEPEEPKAEAEQPAAAPALAAESPPMQEAAPAESTHETVEPPRSTKRPPELPASVQPQAPQPSDIAASASPEFPGPIPVSPVRALTEPEPIRDRGRAFRIGAAVAALALGILIGGVFVARRRAGNEARERAAAEEQAKAAHAVSAAPVVISAPVPESEPSASAAPSAATTEEPPPPTASAPPEPPHESSQEVTKTGAPRNTDEHRTTPSSGESTRRHTGESHNVPNAGYKPGGI